MTTRQKNAVRARSLISSLEEKNMTLDETNHWLDCLNHLFRNGDLDALYVKLMEQYTSFHELMTLSAVSYS